MADPVARRAIQLPDVRLWMLDQWREGGKFELGGKLMSLNPGLLRSSQPYGHETELQEFFDQVKATADNYSYLDDSTLGDVVSDVVDGTLLEPDDPMDGSFDFPMLAAARLFFVTSDICALIERRAKDLPPTTLTDDIMPWPVGLVYFEEAIKGLATTRAEAQEGSNDWIRALLWAPRSVDTIGISVYTELRGDHSPPPGTDMSRYTPPDPSHYPALWCSGRTDWMVDSDTDAPLESISHLNDAELRVAAMSADRRQLATFWLLVAQGGIVDEKICYPDRSTRRRSDRRDLNLDSNVRIIDVHAPKYKSSSLATERDVEWSRRWIVHEHWRQQAYGPNHSKRRPKLIQEYIKGPPDKPLIEKETVYLLRDEGKKDNA